MSKQTIVIKDLKDGWLHLETVEKCLMDTNAMLREVGAQKPSPQRTAKHSALTKLHYDYMQTKKSIQSQMQAIATLQYKAKQKVGA